MANTFRNWHKPSQRRRAKEKPLSGVFPVNTWVNALTGDCAISFQDGYGKEISFYLDSGTRARLRQTLMFPKNQDDEKAKTIDTGHAI